jgi:hypothetical protein
MSIAGLCCCSLCGGDVLDFELVILGPFEELEAWEIEKNLWVERFSIEDVYFNVIANEPYALPTACQNVGTEGDSDCCGGESGTEICCPISILSLVCPTCLESDCGCPSCENTGKTACGGVQANWLAPTVILNYLNVDGEATGVACCDCANGCSVNAVTNSACYADQQIIVPCPNVDEGTAIYFFGNPTYDTSQMGRMSRIPCDNTTRSAVQGVAIGMWSFANLPHVLSSNLLWGHGNVLFKDEKSDTTCDTLIIKFTSEFVSCYAFTSYSRYASATFGRRYAPISNKYTAGAFVIGRYYKISFIGSTNFTLIGAASNTVGLVFQATGAGTGNGTAYLARTAEELAVNYAGTYRLRCVETESNIQQEFGVLDCSEKDEGNHTWSGIEQPTYVAGTLGDCSCHGNFPYCYGSPTYGTCGTALTADYPTCVNAFTDVISRISNLPDPPHQLVIIFT